MSTSKIAVLLVLVEKKEKQGENGEIQSRFDATNKVRFSDQFSALNTMSMAKILPRLGLVEKKGEKGRKWRNSNCLDTNDETCFRDSF